MGDSQSEDTKWAEDIYWGHFKHIHFSQFLHPGFHKQLAIPKKFSDNLRKKLPDSVTLIGPSGSMWSVKVTAIDDSLFFKHGWPEFANDHPLAENDLLIFKYNGDSVFKVLIFDNKTLCEKEYSYFVKKSENPKPLEPDSSLTKRKIKEIVCDEINNVASSENIECISPENPRDNDGVVVLSRDQIFNLFQKTNSPSRKLTPVRSKRGGRGGRGSASRTSSPQDLKLVSSPSNDLVSEHTRTRRSGYAMYYASNRRLVTEDERAMALASAHAAMSESGNEGLMVMMKPSCVYTRFFVKIPVKWVSKFINLENQDVFLRFGDREWRTRFNYNQLRGTAGIASGWKHFSVDNNLEEADVLVFELGCPVNNSLCFDVKIFRVVPEITELTALSTSQIRSGTKKKGEDEDEEEHEEYEEV